MSLLVLFQSNAASGAYTLNIDPPTYTLTHASPSLLADRSLSITPATYTLTHASVGLLADRLLGVTPAAYTLTHSSLSALVDRLLGVTPAAYALTHSALSLDYAPNAVPDSVGGGGAAYRRPTVHELNRLKRLMGFETAKETREFVKRKPQEAQLALAVFEITADPDALIDAVLAQFTESQAAANLKVAADREALVRLQARAEDEMLCLLLILATEA